jgi:hypothetical protein
MAKNPLKNKRDQARKYKGLPQFEVRGIKDGFTRVLLDDGPFAVDADGDPVDGWRQKTPQSGRSEIIQKCLMRIPDPLKGESGNDEDALIPVFVWDPADGKPAPKVWDPRRQMDISPMPMTPHLRKCMAHFCKERNTILDQARAAVEKNKREQEAKADELVGALAGKLADVVAGKVKKNAGGAP